MDRATEPGRAPAARGLSRRRALAARGTNHVQPRRADAHGARARREYLFCHLSRGARALQPGTRAHRETLDELNEKLADKYFCNYSLFQSMPDHWAIDQVFPILPLSRLNEAPTQRAVLQDITCDSDGRVDLYVDGEGVETSLPLHRAEAGRALSSRHLHGRRVPGNPR